MGSREARERSDSPVSARSVHGDSSIPAAGSEIPLRVLQDSDVREVNIPSIDRLDYFRRKPTF